MGLLFVNSILIISYPKHPIMESNAVITVHTYCSPIGTLLLGSVSEKLCLCDWRNQTAPTAHSKRIDQRLQTRLSALYREGTTEVIETAQIQLEEYFSRQRRIFTLPLLFTGTAFQLMVWQALMQIPYGTTRSYAELACLIGKPTAVRAVANANHANPLSLFVPCHRVIGSNGQLTGYGGGLAIKQQLIRLEVDDRLSTISE